MAIAIDDGDSTRAKHVATSIAMSCCIMAEWKNEK